MQLMTTGWVLGTALLRIDVVVDALCEPALVAVSTNTDIASMDPSVIQSNSNYAVINCAQYVRPLQQDS